MTDINVISSQISFDLHNFKSQHLSKSCKKSLSNCNQHGIKEVSELYSAPPFSPLKIGIHLDYIQPIVGCILFLSMNKLQKVAAQLGLG